jgi:hypothetical protein
MDVELARKPGENNMSDEPPSVTASSTGGVSGDFARQATQPVLVAPSTSGEFNTIGTCLVPIACWRVDDLRFQFGSSFVMPDLRDELQALHGLMQSHQGAPLSIFGHADPVGQDESNKTLSGRRAQAIYALLTRNTDLWEDLYTNTYLSDKWDTDEIQIMLASLGYYTGSIDGINGDNTKNAAKVFQSEQGLAVDGVVGKNTRRKLYTMYMDSICVDGDGKPYQLDPTKDFLTRGAAPGGKGDYQGCGEFNPRLLFSQKEASGYAKEENKSKRNSENAPNRRVVVFLFRPGSVVQPSRWPCPPVKDGTTACRKRFWHDGEAKRSAQLPEARREYEKTHDTFACRFYDRLASHSLCEGYYLQLFRIRLFDPFARPMPYAPYRLSGAGQGLGNIKPKKNSASVQIQESKADAHGWIVAQDLVVPEQITIEWGYAREDTSQPSELVYKRSLYLDLKDDDEEEAAQRRLSNLGYAVSKILKDNIMAYQRAHGYFQTGELQDIKAELWRDHDSANPQPLPPAEPQGPDEPVS